MGIPTAYIWDKTARSFRDGRGRFVSPTVVRQAIDAFGDNVAVELNTLAVKFRSGDINASEFAIESRKVIKSIHLASGTIAAGGRRQLTPAIQGLIGSRIRAEYAFFQGMIRDVESGRQPLDGTFLSRVAQYAAAATPTYEAVRRKLEVDAGDFDQERRVLHSVVPCGACAEYAGRGWQPIGTLPGVGRKCSCHSRCRCTFAFRKSSSYRAAPPTANPSTPPMSSGGSLPPLKFALSPQQAARRSVLVMADVAKLDLSLKADTGGFYVGKDGKGPSAIKGRYATARAFLESAGDDGTPVHPADVSLGPDGQAYIDDGRHRFAVLRDAGVKSVPVAVWSGQAKAFRKLYGAKGVIGMGDETIPDGIPGEAPDDLATFKGGGKSGGKGKGGGSSSGPGKLSGGHWVTIMGHPAYIKGGKVVAGGARGITHGHDGTPHGTPKHASSSIPMRPRKGGVTDSSKAVGKVQAPARDAVQAKADKHVERTGKAVEEARKAHAAAKKALADHDAKAARPAPGLDKLHARHAAAKAKVERLKAEHDAHAAKADKALADAEHARATAKAARASQQIKDADKAQRAEDAAHAAKLAGKAKATPVAHPVTKVTPGKSGMVGKPNPANQARAQAASKASRGESHTVESYAKKHGVGGANAFAHLDKLHAAGKVAHDRHDGTYHVPHGTPAPKGKPAPHIQPRPSKGDIVRSSAPRDAREAAVHADAKDRGKSAMVVTSTPQHAAHKAAGGPTEHHVGGRKVATHHVDEKGRHVVTTHHRDGTTTTIRHNTKESAKRHLEAYVKHRIAKGTKKHAVVGGDLSKFDHRAHGIGGKHHKVTGRVLGDGGQVKFDDDGDDPDGDDDASVATFKGGGMKAAKASTAKPDSPAKVTTKGHESAGKPGGCGTGAGGFQAGNTCGHKGNRNRKVEEARAAHQAAKAEVLQHVKAHRKASKVAAKSGEKAAHPRELHAALKKAAAAHGALKAARDTHRAEQREKRNAAARERRKAGKAPKAPTLREQADAHKSAKGSHDDRARAVWRKAMERNSVASKARDKELSGTMAGQKLKPKYEREQQERLGRLGRQQATATRAARKAGDQIGKGARPNPPAHTGLTSSQARTPSTDKGTRNQRLAVLAARHDIKRQSLKDKAAKAYSDTANRLSLAGKTNTHIEGKAADAAYAGAHAINRRASHHGMMANRLRDAIHDPAKSAAAGRTLKSLGNSEAGSGRNRAVIRDMGNRLTHTELRAAAGHAGVDHGSKRTQQETVDHLANTVGRAKVGAGADAKNISTESVDKSKKPGNIERGKEKESADTGSRKMNEAKPHKVTKSEKDMLEEAARKSNGILYAQRWYSTGSKGGERGGRSTSAIASLVRKGYAENLKIVSSHGPNLDGNTVHSAEYSAKITEAGRKALAAHKVMGG